MVSAVQRNELLAKLLSGALALASRASAQKLYGPKVSRGETISEIAGRNYLLIHGLDPKLARALERSDVTRAFHDAMVSDPAGAAEAIVQLPVQVRALRTVFRGPSKRSPAQRAVATSVAAGRWRRDAQGRLKSPDPIAKRAILTAAKVSAEIKEMKRIGRQTAADQKFKSQQQASIEQSKRHERALRQAKAEERKRTRRGGSKD